MIDFTPKSIKITCSRERMRIFRGAIYVHTNPSNSRSNHSSRLQAAYPSVWPMALHVASAWTGKMIVGSTTVQPPFKSCWSRFNCPPKLRRQGMGLFVPFWGSKSHLCGWKVEKSTAIGVQYGYERGYLICDTVKSLYMDVNEVWPLQIMQELK